MSVEYAIRSLILADATLLSLWSTRYYPIRLPETPIYSSGTYQQISQVNESSHQGNSNLADTRLQITVWTDTYDKGIVIRDNLKRLLRDYHSSVVVAGTRLDRIEWANDVALFEEITQKHQRVIDLLIEHNTVY